MFNNILNRKYRFVLTFKLYIVEIIFSIFNIMFKNILQNYRFTLFLN